MGILQGSVQGRFKSPWSGAEVRTTYQFSNTPTSGGDHSGWGTGRLLSFECSDQRRPTQDVKLAGTAKRAKGQQEQRGSGQLRPAPTAAW